MKRIQLILLVAVLLLASLLVISPVLVPNTILAGAGGIVAFSDGSTIDVTNSTSYIGTPLMLLSGGGPPHGATSNKQLAKQGTTGPGASRFGGGRYILCVVGALCNSTDISSYVILNLGSLTFVVASWYMAVGFVFWVGVLFPMVAALFLGKGKRKKRR